MSGHEFESYFPESGSVDLADQSTSIDETTYAELRDLASRYPQPRSALLPMLHLVQSVDGRISPKGIEACAEVLGITTAQRSRALPDLPTLQEQGIKGYDVSVFFGVVAPAGTPPATVEKLNKAFAHALATPKVKQMFAAQGLEPAPDGTPQQLGRFIVTETAKWKDVVKSSGAQMD